MAIPGEIQIGRISRFFSKWTGSKGPSGRFTFGTEIVPELPLFSGVENRALDSWFRYGAFGTQAALASNVSCVQLRNPAASGVVAVVEKFTFAVSVADPAGANANGIFMRITVNQGTVLGAGTLDQRIAPQNPSLIVSRGNTAGASQVSSVPALQANIAYDFIAEEEQEIPILPGDGLMFQGPINVAVGVAFVWRERPLEPSELTL